VFCYFRVRDFFSAGYRSCVGIGFLDWVIGYQHAQRVFHQAAVTKPLASEPWAQEFWKEESFRANLHKNFVPFRVWGAETWHGKFVNNDDSEMGVLRRTINPVAKTCTEQTTRNVWMFGGSALYGTGVPDWGTLPSYVSTASNGEGQECVFVTNFGVEGYVSNQEVIALGEQLKAGHHPDIVIFYDGVNDAGAAAYASGAPLPYFTFREVQNRVEGSISGRLDFLLRSNVFHVLALTERLLPRRSSGRSPEEVRQSAATALDNYEANLGFARALSMAYGFKLYCFWQPSLYYGHKPLAPFE
jgi:hypothetical protein